MYFAFLFLFTYVLLVDFRPPPQGPSGSEAALYFWVFTLVLEEIRQVSGGPGPVADGVRGCGHSPAQEGPCPAGGTQAAITGPSAPARASSRMRTRAW